MSADTVRVFAYIFWALAGVFLILSVYLFFKLKIKVIADDLSGRRAAREMQAYRENRVNVVQNTVEMRALDTATTALNAVESTTMLEQGTETLLQADTLPLNRSDETESLKNNSLILDEMVIHTAERI